MQAHRLLGFRLALSVFLVTCRLSAQAVPSTPTGASASKPAQSAHLDPGKDAVLTSLSGSLEHVTAEVGRAVVQIFARSYVPGTDSDSSDQLLTSQNSSGSGVLLTPDGYILTNAHVVSGARSLRVELSSDLSLRQPEAKRPGRAMPAKVIGVDRATDLAVVKIDRQDLPYLTLGNSRELKQGQIVLAMGNPLGLENSVSMGVVSAVARQVKSDDFMFYIQTDAPINPGNSGGPLVDTDGHVVGINTFILTQSGGSEGIGFAIPSNIAKLVYTQLRRFGHVHRAELGIMGETITPQMADALDLPVGHGVVISDVEKDSPADQAGLQADDIILALNGRTTATQRQLQFDIFRQGPGSDITLTVQRGEQRMQLIAHPIEKSDPFDALADISDPQKNVITQIGIIGLDITPKIAAMVSDLRRPAGVLVAASSGGQPYDNGGLKSADVIFSVNRKVINSVAELRSALAPMKTGDSVVLLVQRSGTLVYVTLDIE
jgi:serine protease Do